MKILSITILLFPLLATPKIAQEFGEISQEELQMTEFSKDPEADAVILFDKADVRITNNFELEFKRHVRIKILTEVGKEYANVEISSWHEDVICNIDAVSYAPDGEEFELDSDNIIKKETGKFNKISFAIPGVEIGSVIEYEYKKFSEYLSKLEPWLFQDKNYTVLSQFSVVWPKGFTFNKLSLNFAGYDIQEKAEMVRDLDNPNQKRVKSTWIGRDLPGIREEPYMDNMFDEYARMIFNLESYKDDYNYIVIAKTWDDRAEQISKIYDKLVEQSGLTETTLQSIIQTERNELKKAKKIYDFVRTEIKTSGHKIIFGDEFKEPIEVLKDKEGSSSHKNMLLINLLTHAGFNAKPLLISTRKHGKIVPNFCEEGQFNRLICLLRINKKLYFLHTGLKANPFGCLTPATDVAQGLLIEGDKGQIINLNPIRPTNRVEIETEADINEDGMITAYTHIIYKGCPAMLERDAIEDGDIEDHVTDFLKELYAEAVLDTFYYTGIDSIEKPLTLSIQYSLPNYIDESDQLVYFSAPQFTCIDENPFVSQRRYFSIDYNYKIYTREKIRLNLPSNLTVNEIPSRKKCAIRDYSYSRFHSSKKDYVECVRSTNLKNRKIDYRYYSKLKGLYDEMVAGDQEQIVLSKVNEQN